MSAPESAAAGAAVLDREVPGWHNRIDLGQLRMSNCAACILGQLTGDYCEAVKAEPWADLDREALGLTVPDVEPEPWFDLDEAWAREIITRRLNDAFDREMDAWRAARPDWSVVGRSATG